MTYHNILRLRLAFYCDFTTDSSTFPIFICRRVVLPNHTAMEKTMEIKFVERAEREKCVMELKSSGIISVFLSWMIMSFSKQ